MSTRTAIEEVRAEAHASAPDGVAPDRAPVSVIIPCYNQAHFLAEAIESVRRQSYRPIEIVVVDDGSGDDTARVAAAYPEVRYIRQENQGLAAARNAGAVHSRGVLLVFLDADDRLLPYAVETGVECLSAHPNAAFASGHFRYIDRDGQVLHEYPQPAVDADGYAALLRGNHIGMHATVMYRRDALEAVGGFDDALRACEDYDLYLRLAHRYPVCRHAAVVAEYRQHDTNMSADSSMMLQTVLSVLERQREHALGDPRRREALHAGRSHWKRHYARVALEQLRSTSGRQRLSVRERARAAKLVVQYGPGAATSRVRSALARLRVRIGRSMPGLASREAAPRVGGVAMGDLRRLTPISTSFGYDRGRPIDRYYIEAFLARHAPFIRGRVLEIGDNEYTLRYGAERVTQSDVLHVSAGNPKATLIGDLASAPHIPSDAFDCVVLTQTLHLIYDVRAALATLYRILKPGGVLLATFPGISQIDQGEWGDTWYWGFTQRSAKRLFEEVFPADGVTLTAHGNVLTAVGFLHGMATEELKQAELDATDPHFPLVITARAEKPCAPHCAHDRSPLPRTGAAE